MIYKFPPVEKADKDGLLAVGGDLSSDCLLSAYQQGIFPWFNEGDPILWWSPNPRFVLFPEEFKISKSTRKLLNNNTFEFTENHSFKEVISSCSIIKRQDQKGTWITSEIIEAYCQLHELGFAKSVEAWQNDQLVGGFYGIDLGEVFCGESMFSKVSNASKCAFTYFVKKYDKQYAMIDCQIYSEYLESLGAREIDRENFISLLLKFQNLDKINKN